VTSHTESYGLPNYAPPSNTYGTPETTSPPRIVYGTPEKAPSDTYGLPNKAPADSYGLPNKAPSDNYGLPNKAPADSYGLPNKAPSDNYGLPNKAPSDNYGLPNKAPSESYGTPASHSHSTSSSVESYGPPTHTSSDGYEDVSHSSGGYSSPSYPTSEYGAPAQQPAENREVRFLIHKAGDEEIVKNAVIEDSKWSGNKISFIQGPNLEVKHHQKVYLPPQKKSIIYVLLKEPEIKTSIEVMEPNNHEQAKPEVFIIYESGNGVIKKHYDLSPEEGSKVGAILANRIRQTRASAGEDEKEDAVDAAIEEMFTSTAKSVSSDSEGAETTTSSGPDSSASDQVLCKSSNLV
jgi:hypothetical protein